jgi:glutathione S-transferase
MLGVKLYGNPLSPRYRRVVVAAAELGVPLDLVVLNPGKGETRAPAYIAKNPMGKMPTFEEDDGWTLWESLAVVVYLAETHPTKGLFPTDARSRAEALRWMFFCASHLDPAVESLYTQKFLSRLRGQAVDEAAVASAKKDLDRYLPVFEARMETQPWVLGPSFSLVDVALGTSVDTLFKKELEFDRKACPAIAAWHSRLSERPYWSAAAS